MNLVQKTKHKKLCFFSSFCLLIGSLFVTNSCSQIISNYELDINVEKVVDGDTFISKNNSYRILGIDSPETFDSSNNFTQTTGSQFFYGNIAKKIAKKILENHNIKVETLKSDKYNRLISRVTLDNEIDFGSYMIENGYAIVRYISPSKYNQFYYYDNFYIENLYNLQSTARKNKKGFWTENLDTLKKIYPGFKFGVV